MENTRTTGEILYPDAGEQGAGQKNQQVQRVDVNDHLKREQTLAERLYGRPAGDTEPPTDYLGEIAKRNREARAEEQDTDAGDDQPDSQDQGDQHEDQVEPQDTAAVRERLSEMVEQAGLEPDAAERFEKLHEQAQRVAWAEQTAAWEHQARQDATINDGDFEQNISQAQALIERHGDRELVELLEAGLGNHPALARFLVRIAKSQRGGAR